MIEEIVDLPERVTWVDLHRAVNDKLMHTGLNREDLRILAGVEMIDGFETYGGPSPGRLKAGMKILGIPVV